MGKTLVAYYSRPGENYVNGQIRRLETGNTARAASIVAKLTDGDLFEIAQAQPYADSYDRCTAQAQADQRGNVRPALKSWPVLEGYDVIYLGYPNYWNTMPMAVFTFLEGLDFRGKIIHPFCTHEGSGMGSSERDIRRLVPEATVTRGLAIRGSDAGNCKKEVERWIQETKA